MRVVLLAGGLGTRLGEETQARPKPMVEIGGKPILWHIMKYYSSFGLTEFVVCLGYKGYMIKEYFANYFLHTSDVTFDLSTNDMRVHANTAEPWTVSLIDTGPTTQTGGRIKRIAPYLDGDDYCMTYGDGLSDVDIGALLTFHQQHGRLATVTAVSPRARFGALTVEDNRATCFEEKPHDPSDMINGGFFVLSPKVLDLIDGDDTLWEREPMQSLVRTGDLMVHRHFGFWQPMDMLRDKLLLEALWSEGNAPWLRW